MKRIRFFWIVLLVLLVGITQGGYAQGADVTLHLTDLDLRGFPKGTLRLSVWDVNGRPLTDLNKENFSLSLDDGAAFQPDEMRLVKDAPVTVALVLDISTSMAGQPLADAREAANRFLAELDTGDQAALIAFSSPVVADEMDAQREFTFTDDFTPLYDRIEALRAGGGTELYNAVGKAIRLAAQQPAGHRAVLLLSDGKNDPAEVGDALEPIELAKQANIPVFVIGLGTEIDTDYLSRLASDTGGFFRAVPRSSELAAMFEQMAALLKTQYTLAFSIPLASDGKTHTLTVTLNTTGGDAQISINTGVFPAAPQPSATPKASSMSISTATAAQPSVPTHTVAPALGGVTQTPSGVCDNLWMCVVGGIAAVVVVAALLLLMTLRRHRKGAPMEACAKCGYVFKPGENSACPVCGETRRLKKLPVGNR